VRLKTDWRAIAGRPRHAPHLVTPGKRAPALPFSRPGPDRPEARGCFLILIDSLGASFPPKGYFFG
jgi:hypothetical protein